MTQQEQVAPSKIVDEQDDQLTLTVSTPKPAVVVVTARGEIDLATVPHLRECLRRHVRPGQHLVVDTTAVRFCRPVGIAELRRAANAARMVGATFCVVVPALPHQVRQLLKTLGVAGQLPVALNLTAAVDEPRLRTVGWRFFVPGAADSEQTYIALGELWRLPVIPLAGRLASITFVRDGTTWTATVGRALTGERVERRHRRGGTVEVSAPVPDPATVLAIFGGGDLYHVVTDARPLTDLVSAVENPIMVGDHDLTTSVRFEWRDGR